MNSRRLLIGLGLSAFAWAVFRAWNQAITIDEADTYLGHVATGLEWLPGANNHVLNTILIRISTALFGVSAFTVRIPALCGAALYLWATIRLCRLVSVEWYVRTLLFIAMVFNPLIGDFLVAARGYGLALGFLMLGIVYAAERIFQPVRGGNPLLIGTISSACFGLSFSANFSFAFVDAAAAGMVFLGIWRLRSAKLVQALAAASLPALFTMWLITRDMILDFPRDQLWYGAKTLAQTMHTLSEASLYQINARFMKPELFEPALPFLLPFALFASLLWALGAAVQRRRDFRVLLALSLAGIAGIALAGHWAIHRWNGLLLPQDRTGIYLVALLTASAGTVLAIDGVSRSAKLLRGIQIVAFSLLSAFYLLCLRTDHFKEWQYDSESDKAYAILSCLHQEQQVNEITSSWMYISVLNFYQAASPNGRILRSITDSRDHPPPSAVWAVNHVFDTDDIEKHQLKLIYKGLSNMAIGVTPEMAARLQTSTCLQAVGASLP